MIKALTVAAQALGSESNLERAVRAMRFCTKYLLTEDFDIHRTCYAEENGIGNLPEPKPGCVDDFANLVAACLGLFQASGGEAEWIELARKVGGWNVLIEIIPGEARASLKTYSLSCMSAKNRFSVNRTSYSGTTKEADTSIVGLTPAL